MRKLLNLNNAVVWSRNLQTFVKLDWDIMTRNQALAVRYAEALLEDSSSINVTDMFADQDLSEEDQREIYTLLSKVTVCFPPEWDTA